MRTRLINGVRFCSVFDVKCAVFGFNAFDFYLRYDRSHVRRLPQLSNRRSGCRSGRYEAMAFLYLFRRKRDILPLTANVSHRNVRMRKSELQGVFRIFIFESFRPLRLYSVRYSYYDNNGSVSFCFCVPPRYPVNQTRRPVFVMPNFKSVVFRVL